MKEKSTGKWLQFESGKDVVVKFLEEKSTHDVVHWVGGKNAQCTGKGCKFCAVGMTTRERDHVDVEVDGRRQVMTLPAVAFDTMLQECIAPGPLKGIVVMVTPMGTGQNRRYKFHRLEGVPGVPEPVGATIESLNMSVLYQLLVEWDTVLLGVETAVVALREHISHVMDVVQRQQRPNLPS